MSQELIPISKPALGVEELSALQRVLESGILAQGPRVAEFERGFAEAIGVEHAIATSSGTTALHVALLAHDIGPGHEVITTPFTFIASVNAILYTGARPVFVDIDESFNLNAERIEAAVTAQTRAIMPVHLFGQPADLGAIGDIARRHKLVLIEDACQAHAACFDGKYVGSFGTGCFSFYATKNMTTGEGGMLTTDDAHVAEQARMLINHGMRVRYYHDQLGYNFRMTEMAATIGIEQLRKLTGFNARREENAAFYSEHLGQVKGLVLPQVRPRRTHVWHQYTLRVTRDFACPRDQLADRLRAVQIGTGVYYPVPVHLQKTLQAHGWHAGAFPTAERFAQEVLSIPVHPQVDDAQRAHVIEKIQEIARGD